MENRADVAAVGHTQVLARVARLPTQEHTFVTYAIAVMRGLFFTTGSGHIPCSLTANLTYIKEVFPHGSVVF